MVLNRKDFGVDLDMPLEAGGVVVGDEVTVKRLRRRGHAVQLLSENPDFKPIELDLRHEPDDLALLVDLRAPGVRHPGDDRQAPAEGEQEVVLGVAGLAAMAIER